MKTVAVSDLKHVDTTMYKDGDIFISDKKIAILHKGKLDPLVKQSELKNYVKKSDVLDMIDEAVKKVNANV